MKQNYSIVFHSTQNSLINSYHRWFLAAVYIFIFCLAGRASEIDQTEPYKAYFDPVKGFKPAQTDFPQIFLQLAGSLEYYGSPEPYIRHIMAEHTRIDAFFTKATGKSGSSRPAYFTDEYLENLVGGWNKLTPALKLSTLSLLTGRDMRYAILGSWNKSVSEILDHETNLTEPEKTSFRQFMQKDHFTRADFPALEAFYKQPYDKLTEEGKSQLSTRIHLGMLPPDERKKAIEDNKGGTLVMKVLREHQKKTLTYIETLVNSKLAKVEKVNSDNLQTTLITCLKLNQEKADWGNTPSSEHDSLQYSHDIKAAFQKRFDYVRTQSPEQAEIIEKAVLSMVENLVALAQSEYEASLYDALAEHLAKGKD